MQRKYRRLQVLCLAAIAACSMFAVSAGSAQASSGPFSLDITNARMDLGVLQGADILAPPSAPANLTGTIESTTGAYTVPKDSFDFPEQSVDTPVGAANVKLTATQDITGVYTDATGVMTAHLVFQADVGIPAVSATCSIGPVSLDLTTETLRPYAGKKFTSGLTGDGGVSSAWSSLPTPTGGGICATLGGLIAGPGAIWLGRGTPPTRVPLVCPGDNGCPPPVIPTCATDASLCTPILGAVTVTPPKATVKAGKSVTLKAKVTNTGDGAASGVKVCATGNKKLVKVPKCQTKTIAAGGSTTVALKITAQKKAKSGKAKVTVTASSAAAGKKSGTSTLTVKAAKKKKH